MVDGPVILRFRGRDQHSPGNELLDPQSDERISQTELIPPEDLTDQPALMEAFGLPFDLPEDDSILKISTNTDQSAVDHRPQEAVFRLKLPPQRGV